MRRIIFALVWANYIIFVVCIAIMTISGDTLYLTTGIIALGLGFGLAIIHACMKPSKPQQATFATWSQQTNWFANHLHHDDEPYVAYAGIDTEEQEAFIRQCGTL